MPQRLRLGEVCAPVVTRLASAAVRTHRAVNSVISQITFPLTYLTNAIRAGAQRATLQPAIANASRMGSRGGGSSGMVRSMIEGLETRRLMAGTVDSLVLYNADNNQAITTLQAGASLDLAALPTRHLNVVANPSGSVDEVRFGLDGNASYRSEHLAPFALAADDNGDLYSWVPAVGAHTIVATAYDNGSAGGSKSINFTVTDSGAAQQAATSITNLNLYNADNNQFITTLQSGATLDLGTLPTRNLNVVAVTSSPTTSVKFALDGNSNFRTETVLPYALAADNNGDLYGWTPSVGSHTLTATAYNNSTTGGSKTVNFTVIDSKSGGTPAGTTTPVVSSLSLINSDTDQVISNLTNGASIDLKNASHLSVAANVSGTVQTVRFGLDGNANYHLESTAPYAIAGGTGSDYSSWTPSVGSHTLTVTALSGTGASGALTVNFNVVNTTTTQPLPPPPPPPTIPNNPVPIPSGPSPVANIQFLDTTVPAGHAIFVNGLGSNLSAGTPLTARYNWDFGDPNGDYNTLVGFNAAHLYETAGTYNVKLTITNENGAQNTVTNQITVTADNRPTIYISSSTGSDANDGRSAATAVRTTNRANDLITNNMRIMFKRGDTFDLTQELQIKKTDILVGAYGSGNKPVLRQAISTLSNLIWTAKESNTVTIRDLNFDSIYGASTEKSGATRGWQASGTNAAIVDCTFTNVTDAVNGEFGPSGVLVQNCAVPTLTGERGYFVWASGDDYVILGNSTPNATREHILRLGNSDRMLIAHNDFQNISRVDVGDSKDIDKGVFTLQAGSYLYISDNNIRHGGMGTGPLGGPDGTTTPNDRTSWVVIEDNTTFDAGLAINPGSEHIMVRNNVFQHDDLSCITLNTSDTASPVYVNRTIADVSILNNTGIDMSTTGRFIEVAGRIAGQITMANNLFKAPNLVTGGYQSALIYVNDSDLGSFRQISNNVYSIPITGGYANGGYFYVYPYWSNSLGYWKPDVWNSRTTGHNDKFEVIALGAGFAPTSTLAKTGAAPVKGVLTDMTGKWRPASGWSAGAVQA